MESPSGVVGRRLELEQITGCLNRLAQGLVACALTGPAGIGKTIVWRRGVQLARQGGFAVLTTRPAGAEARLSYSGLSDLLSPIDSKPLDDLPDVQRRALDVALLRSGPADGAIDARAVASGLLSLLRSLAAAAPVVVAVDDAQWLDAASAAALAYALRRLEDARVGVLATIRTDEERPHTFVDALAAERRAQIAIGPLDVASIHAVLKNELGRVPVRPVLTKIVAVSGGNPFHAIEIARELCRIGESMPLERLPVPAEVQGLVRTRVERLPADTRDALVAAAALNAPHTSIVPASALAAAEEADIVRIAADGRIRFRHPLFAAAVYESAATVRRRAVHRDLAARVADPEERARHLALGSDAADASVARELDAAARLARLRGAPDAAAELAQLALRLTPEGDEGRHARVLAAAALHAASGDLARAQTLLEASIDRLPHGSLRARALQSVGQLHVRRSSFNDAIRCAFEALREAGEDKVLAAEIELDLAYGIGSLGDIAGGATHARQAVALADAGAPAALTAKVLAASAMMQFLCGDGLASAVVERAVALEEPRAQGPLQMRPSYIHAILLIWSGRPAEALPVLYRLRGELIETGSDSELPLLSVFIVWALLWCGDVAQAVAVADRAAQTASLLDDRLAVALARSAGALARAYAGQTELARRDAAHAAALFDELQYRPGAIWPPWALGFLELSLGNPDGAHAVLGPLAHIFGAAPGDPVLSVFMPDEIEALIDLGQADRAEELLASFEARARSVERAWALGAAARCRGLLLAARGDLDRALAAFEEALRWHARSPMPFARARTCLELGRVQRRRKQKRQARVALEDALTAFERVGTPLWADRARAELARVRTRTSRPGLTATEERIARLAAEGLTNRAIAERAFVTVNTVEANLTRVYRKLRISSRAQLARALGDPLDPIS